jgi:hypothetical protein
MRKLKKGDLLYVMSVDRLGRNCEEIQTQRRIITKEKGADIVVLDMPLLDTRQHKDLIGTLLSDMVLQLLSFCAHNERDNTKKRQATAMPSAKARGKHLGRPVKQAPADLGGLGEGLGTQGNSALKSLCRVRKHQRGDVLPKSAGTQAVTGKTSETKMKSVSQGTLSCRFTPGHNATVIV